MTETMNPSEYLLYRFDLIKSFEKILDETDTSPSVLRYHVRRGLDIADRYLDGLKPDVRDAARVLIDTIGIEDSYWGPGN